MTKQRRHWMIRDADPDRVEEIFDWVESFDDKRLRPYAIQSTGCGATTSTVTIRTPHTDIEMMLKLVFPEIEGPYS